MPSSIWIYVVPTNIKTRFSKLADLNLKDSVTVNPLSKTLSKTAQRDYTLEIYPKITIF